MISLVRVIRCDCGFEASGDGDDELIIQAQAHARDVHNMDVPNELVSGPAEAGSTEVAEP